MNAPDIHWFAWKGLVDDILKAVKSGVDVNQKDSLGDTALICAVARKHPAAAQLLLENGADPCIQDNEGSTALHYALEHKLNQVVEEILRKNPGIVHIANKYGNQPLWTAAFNARGNYDSVSLLLRYGADPEHCNNVNLSPIDMAKRFGDDALLAILESAKRRQA